MESQSAQYQYGRPVERVPDDLRLLKRYAETGCQRAFGELVSRHVGWVYTVCRRGLGDRHLAEDATQAVFLTLARRAATMTPDVRLSGWLFKTARFAVADLRKRERRHRRRWERAVEAFQQRLLPSQQQAWERLAPLLDDALAALAEQDRAAILLRYYQGLTLEEVALSLGLTRNGAKKRVARAVEKMRAYFARHHITLAGTTLAVVLAARASEGASPELGAAIVARTIGCAAPSGLSLAITQHLVLKTGGMSTSLFSMALVAELLLLVGMTGYILWRPPSTRSSPVVAVANRTAACLRSGIRGWLAPAKPANEVMSQAVPTPAEPAPIVPYLSQDEWSSPDALDAQDDKVVPESPADAAGQSVAANLEGQLGGAAGLVVWSPQVQLGGLGVRDLMLPALLPPPPISEEDVAAQLLRPSQRLVDWQSGDDLASLVGLIGEETTDPAADGREPLERPHHPTNPIVSDDHQLYPPVAETRPGTGQSGTTVHHMIYVDAIWVGGSPHTWMRCLYDSETHQKYWVTAVVPEPGTLGMLGIGLACLVGRRPPRKRAVRA